MTKTLAMNKDGDFGLRPFFVLFLIQIVTFNILYILKRWLMPASIVFYEGLLLTIGFFVLGLVGTLFVRKLGGRLTAYWIPAVVAAFLFNYAFLITIPALLDRSISITVIGALAQGGDKGVTFDDLNRAFLKSYVDGDRQVRKRLTEQLAGNHIVDHDGSYSLTPKGWFIYKTSLFLTKLYHIDLHCILAQRTPVKISPSE